MQGHGFGDDLKRFKVYVYGPHGETVSRKKEEERKIITCWKKTDKKAVFSNLNSCPFSRISIVFPILNTALPQ